MHNQHLRRPTYLHFNNTRYITGAATTKGTLNKIGLYCVFCHESLSCAHTLVCAAKLLDNVI